MDFQEPTADEWASDDLPPPKRRRWIRVVGLLTLLAFVVPFGLQTWATLFRDETSDDRSNDSTDGVSEAVPLPETLTDPVKVRACFGLDMPPEDATDGVDPGLAWDEIRPVAEAVARGRELEFKREVPAKVVSKEEIDERIARDYEREYGPEQANRDGRALSTLGLVEPDTDMRDVLGEAVEGRILGFYLPEEERLVVRSQSGELSPAEEVTLAHELEHALVDQVFDLPDHWSSDPTKGDEVLSLRSLIEGDATLAEARYLYLALTTGERTEVIGDSSGALAGLGSVPHFVERSLSFPYVEGAAFACELYLEGGWDAVNAAYEDPPRTTAEVLFPELYLQDFEPRRPRRLGQLKAPWKPEPRSSFGAADLLFLLEAPGGRRADQVASALEAIEAWSGGEMRMWIDGDRTALGFAIATKGDPRDLCDALVHWYDTTFEGDSAPAITSNVTTIEGPEQSAVIVCDALEIDVGIGPNDRIARKVSGAG